MNIDWNSIVKHVDRVFNPPVDRSTLSFEDAFATTRQKGDDEFSWRGKIYNTKTSLKNGPYSDAQVLPEGTPYKTALFTARNGIQHSKSKYFRIGNDPTIYNSMSSHSFKTPVDSRDYFIDKKIWEMNKKSYDNGTTEVFPGKWKGFDSLARRKAFNAAKDAGKKTFMFDGLEYTTEGRKLNSDVMADSLDSKSIDDDVIPYTNSNFGGSKALFSDANVYVPDLRQPISRTDLKTQPNYSFGGAFAAARKAGVSTFQWNGKTYTTETKDDYTKRNKTPIEMQEKSTELSGVSNGDEDIFVPKVPRNIAIDESKVGERRQRRIARRDARLARRAGRRRPRILTKTK